jgi:tripartite-type tricarboxylate transporter receptor subunit TctC
MKRLESSEKAVRISLSEEQGVRLSGVCAGFFMAGIGVCAVTATAQTAGTGSPQSYPAKPVRIIVPYASGGTVDIIARIVSPRLTDALAQQFLVDNRAGGGAIIGTQLLAKSPPDGYTTMLANPAHAANPALRGKLPYDTLRDFSSVGLVALSASILVVHPSLPVKSVRQLVALAKARPGQLNYASSGTGGAGYLAMELFKSYTGIELVHVPYKGAAPALTDVLGGQVPMMFITIPTVLPHVKAGKLQVLAASSAKRNFMLPEVPTVAESGYPGFENADWYGVIVPAGTPREVVLRLNTEINRALALPEVKERINGLGADVAGGTPEQLDERIRTEVARWRKIIKQPVMDN